MKPCKGTQSFFLAQIHTAWFLTVVIIMCIESFLFFDPFRIIWPSIEEYADPIVNRYPFYVSKQYSLKDDYSDKIVILGNSQVREAIDTNLLQTILHERGEDLSVHLVYFPAAEVPSLFGSLDLAFHGERVIGIVGVSWSIFYEPEFPMAKAERGIFTFKRFITFLGYQGVQEALLNHRRALFRFTLRRLFPSFNLGTDGYKILQTALRGEPVAERYLTSSNLPRVLNDLNKRVGRPELQKASRAALLVRTLKDLRGRLDRLILIDMPIAPQCLARLPRFQRLYDYHVKKMKEYRERFSFDYIQVSQLPHLKEKDFWDCTHVKESARLRITHYISDSLFSAEKELKDD